MIDRVSKTKMGTGRTILPRTAACVYMLILVVVMMPASDFFLAGTTDGLFNVSRKTPLPLWTEGEVKKIVHSDSSFFLLTSKGIIYTRDFTVFQERNAGLPVKTIKRYENGQKSFDKEIQDIKDFEIVPDNPEIMVCATKDNVYISRDGGKQWKKLGISARTTGVKAVGAALLRDSPESPKELVVFMSHPIYGISYIKPDSSDKKWTEIPDGLDLFATTDNPNETADILVAADGDAQNVFASQSFSPRIYTLDWYNKKWVLIAKGSHFADTYEGLTKVPGGLIYTAVNRLERVSFDTAEPKPCNDLPRWLPYFNAAPGKIRCAYLDPRYSAQNVSLQLSELWLLNTGTVASPYARLTSGRKGLYIPVHQLNYPQKYAEHRQTLKNNNLNMVVVDMKDDYGILRFSTDNPLLLKKGKIGRTVNLDSFIAEMKADNIYLVARIVVFKDPVLASYGNNMYAVKDCISGEPWKGYRIVKEKVPVPEGMSEEEAKQKKPEYVEVKKEYDEVWVDPYCEEVWEYNTEIACELIKRGFNEIQFDYIRFPTDGKNLHDAVYPWQDAGMDKESALMSFLSYARSRIAAPLSIDIYGANGMYRSGVRTGQDVELIARYVDVICPMFYPNHFENSFMGYEPAVDRPYRIYYYGTYRNTVIARNQVVIRPYAQAFYMGVAYDKQYYNNDYVQRQVFAVRDVLNRGYTYWNNSGRYDDLRPDPSDDAPYPWAAIPIESKSTDKPFLHAPSR